MGCRLKPGKGKKVISLNIERLIRAGYPQKQAAAAAYEKAGRTGRGKKK